MKEIYVPKRVPRVSVREKLHGHAKIDLFNTQTKQYKRVEHDNFFTDGWESAASDIGSWPYSSWFKNLSSSPSSDTENWRTFLGGLFLFDTALPETAIYMPAGTTMIGNAAYGYASTGAVPELGSWNDSESSCNSDTITMVYDFTTAQANGTIASLALTNVYGGQAGYGNISDSYISNLVRFDGNFYSGQLVLGLYVGCILAYGNAIYAPSSYAVSSGATSVSVTKLPISFTELDIFGSERTPLDEGEEIVFTLPSALSNGYKISAIGGSVYPSCFILEPNGYSYMTSGSSFPIYLLDVSDGSVTEYTITNNLDYPIDTLFPVGENILLAYARAGNSEYYAYQINMTTSVVIGQAYTPNGNIVSGFQTYGAGFGPITDGLYAGLAATNTTPYAHYIYDPVKNRFSYSNTSFNAIGSSYSFYQSPRYVADGDFIFACMPYGNSAYLCVFHNILRLATINNLDSSVTKTAAQTMKVTYTVTRSS